MTKKAFLIISTIGILSLGYIFLNNVKKPPTIDPTQKTENPQIQMDAQSLLAAISKLIIIPQGETPTIATIVDPSQLKSQPFFVNAKKNDKLFIFTNAKEAILYNPSENKIVKVAPITIDSAGIETPTTTTEITTTTLPQKTKSKK